MYLCRWSVFHAYVTYSSTSFSPSITTTSRSAAIHALANFVKRALDDPESFGFNAAPSRAVTGAFLFVCRQFYSTSEGLLVLHPYGLHDHVANAWRIVSFLFAILFHHPQPIVMLSSKMSLNSNKMKI